MLIFITFTLVRKQFKIVILLASALAPFFTNGEALAQSKKTAPKQAQRSAPKIVFDILHAGNSKNISVKTTELKCSIKGTSDQNNKVDVMLNGKAIVENFSVTASTKNPNLTSSFKIKLAPKVNLLTFSANKLSANDSFNINFVVDDSLNEYRYMAKCAKNKKTTLIISKQ